MSDIVRMESAIADLFLAHSAKELEQFKDLIAGCLERLSEDQIWNRTAESENSAGNLVLHLCGNVTQWIVAGVGGEADSRDRDSEFSARRSLSRAELIARLEETVEKAAGVIRDLPGERLIEVIDPQTGPVSVLGAIYHVVGHFQQHAGQIIFITKNRLGEDLKLTRLPARSGNTAAAGNSD